MLWRKWGWNGGNGKFPSPDGLTVSSSDEVFVCDDSNIGIQVFSVDGQFLLTWGSSGSGNRLFNCPSGVAVSSSGELFVCDEDINHLRVFNFNRQYLRTWGSKWMVMGNFMIIVASKWQTKEKCLFVIRTKQTPLL